MQGTPIPIMLLFQGTLIMLVLQGTLRPIMLLWQGTPRLTIVLLQGTLRPIFEAQLKQKRLVRERAMSLRRTIAEVKFPRVLMHLFENISLKG